MIDVDPQVLVESRKNFLEMDRAIDGVFPEPVRRADYLAGLHSAAGEQCARNLRPVVSAGVFVDLGSATEFTEDRDQCVGQ